MKTQLRNSSKKMPEKIQGKRFTSTFANKVYALVAKIPKGKTMTYGQVAKVAGKPGAARAVGMFMANNYNPKIPCHRVVRSDGKVGNYNRGGAVRKAELLREEGFK
jgi:methylated-DNA-[protein]-cysteine S-methyltransferase